MPLEVLPDRFGDAKHNDLDKAVNQATKGFNNYSAQQILPFLPFLLSSITENSNGKLNPEFIAAGAGQKLIDTHMELRDMLTSSWERKSYRDVRNLAILAAPGSVQKRSLELQNVYQNLSQSFKGKYYGAAVGGLYEYLSKNEMLFQKDGYYAKFCSVVQSSGTGKSRMLTELANKGIITIYMNLRNKDDELSFPPRDETPSMLLTNFHDNEIVYSAYCYAFFIALFCTVTEYLSTDQATSGTKESVMYWARQMCDTSEPPRSAARANFFANLASNYRKSYDDLRRSISETLGVSSILTSETDVMDTDTELHTVVKQFAELISKPGEKDHPHPLVALRRLLKESFGKMADSLEKVFPNGTTEPKLVIAMDEAYPLTARQQNYRPAHIFCKVVQEYSHIGPKDHGVWVVFASTTSKVADFSPPSKMHNSYRVAIQGQKLFPPYTQLGWDQGAPQFEAVDPVHVSQAKNIVGFGRPLWLSLKCTESDPGQVLTLASEKLCGAPEYDPCSTDQVLAIFGQRFAINVKFGHPDSVEHLENGVASHLCICHGTTPDRTWMFTGYPSEPFLSCAASRILHHTAETLELSLRNFLSLINAGMIDMGERGELASRLLWLLAKDLFVRDKQGKKNAFPSSWDQHLVDCEMIPVVDWLEFIFGEKFWGKESYKNKFEDAYVNFSHWVRMTANIAGSDPEEELPLNKWTLRHWQRTSAVQCSHPQPHMDKVIPIYFKNYKNHKGYKNRKNLSAVDGTSQLLISDKARGSKGSATSLSYITRKDNSIGGKQSVNTGRLPYIAILVDLAWQRSPFSVKLSEWEVEDRCLRIYAPGINTTTYPFLAAYPALQQVLEDLVCLQKVPDTKQYFSQYLDAQVKFGSTPTAKHMEWERGGKLPQDVVQS